MIFRIAFFILIFSPSLFAQQTPSNLIIRLYGANRELLVDRIGAAAESVGPQGRVIFDYTTPSHGPANNDRGEINLDINPQELMQSLPTSLRSRVLLVNSREAYSYPRDTSYGWGTGPNGTQQLIGWERGNNMRDREGKEYTSYSTLGIAALLVACEGSQFSFPSLRRSAIQGGQVVSNGQGICIANSDVRGTLESAGDQNVLGDIGCQKVIWGPNVHDLRRMGLMNGHVDLNAIFVGPRHVMLPTVDASCQTPLREEWRKLRESLVSQNLEIVEVPVAGGCVERNPNISEGIGSRYIRSYSNVVVLNDALLVPEFRGENNQATRALRPYNDRARAQLQRLMDEGKIPRRRIVGYPVTEAEAQAGGEVRCMSLEVPGAINRCTQDRLNKAIEDLVKQANDRATCLASGTNAELCRLSRDIHSTIKFLHEEHARQREMTTAEGTIIRILNQSRDLLGTATERLGTALRACSAN